jgi:Protein of unknown function (DUF2892)
MKNMNSLDRIARLFIAIIIAELSFFWLGGSLSIIGYVLAAIMVITSFVGFCPLYKPFGICSLKKDSVSLKKKGIIITIILLLGLLIGGSFTSELFSRKIFLNDFNAMNNFYKQALFQTGQNNRDKSSANFNAWKKAFDAFEVKYKSYKPFAIMGDSKWNQDMKAVSEIIKSNSELVLTGDLNKAHLALEKVRPIFQDAFKRNGFSMLSLALVDFHDVMELILDAANEKNAAKVTEVYIQADEKLKAVEQAENDAEIQAIRQNLDALNKLANDKKNAELPAKASELKSSFVKVYLKRG